MHLKSNKEKRVWLRFDLMRMERSVFNEEMKEEKNKEVTVDVYVYS